jgi:hypothetical protein
MVRVLHLEHSCVVYGAEIGTLQKIDQNYLESSEMCWRRMNKFLGRSCEKWRNITKSLGGNEHPTENKTVEG